MQESDLAQLLRDTFLVLFKLGGPVLAVGLAVGVVMSLIQAITQINEPALAFVPKVAAIVTTDIAAMNTSAIQALTTVAIPVKAIAA